MLAEQALEEQTKALEAKKGPVVIDTTEEDEGETLEVVRLPDPEPFIDPRPVRERDRGRS